MGGSYETFPVTSTPLLHWLAECPYCLSVVKAEKVAAHIDLVHKP